MPDTSLPRIVSTIECRMTSSRLPGKVMMTSAGKTMLEHHVERLSRVAKIDEILFATTTNPQDDCIASLAQRLGIGCHRGSEEDVLARVLGAAESVGGDVIVEITGDCPLIDPSVVAQTLDLYLANPCDYACNDNPLSYPIGMDVEVFSTRLLRVAHEEGLTPEDREHVSWFFLRNPERFRLLTLPAPPELHWPDLRLTLDEQADYQLIDAVFRALYPANPAFSLADVLTLLRAHPELLQLNAHVIQRFVAQSA
ncbi:8-amino-3,8-dideoxy-manno-octulosonate cytidylyltransferase [Fundidesulfovibrio magnetotacticus]|uniref:8-amino-3,8-dideoxy-manno-octulosonate cytidylyltransferase n=1 Tax=Fundidesulfovibrio magnetotacticus TaxID=2730080 RepID=A0A6V8LQT8_9BACT|nr:glycosyltransferase family protein [Fundidesulfovibrio magnetotacticus]GFK94853.1 8-amino-3,8-dideoxy-manno-octulosonate cytidylyltransferase [Fundidesulfovibrio magnetotacticus]